MRCLRKDCIHEVHTVAYFLWLLGGPLGLYKFYLGRPFRDSCISSPVGFFWAGSAIFSPYHTRSRWPILLQHQPERPSSAMRRELEHFKHLLYRQLQVTPMRPLQPGVNL